RADSSGALFHTRIRREFSAACGVELGRRPTVMPQQTTDPVSGEITLFTRVDKQRAATGPAQHQTGAQSGRAAADDDAVPHVVHASSLPTPAAKCQTGLPCRQIARTATSTRGSGSGYGNFACSTA